MYVPLIARSGPRQGYHVSITYAFYIRVGTTPATRLITIFLEVRKHVLPFFKADLYPIRMVSLKRFQRTISYGGWVSEYPFCQLQATEHLDLSAQNSRTMLCRIAEKLLWNLAGSTVPITYEQWFWKIGEFCQLRTTKLSVLELIMVVIITEKAFRNQPIYALFIFQGPKNGSFNLQTKSRLRFYTNRWMWNWIRWFQTDVSSVVS